LFDLSLPYLLLRVGAFLFIVAVNGFAFAAIARMLGDKGPTYDGRLSVNPLSHLDLLGLVSAMASQAGWIKPFVVEQGERLLERLRPIACAFLALLVTLVVGALVFHMRTAALSSLPAEIAGFLVPLMVRIGEMSVWFAVFNLLVVPPLAGGYLLLGVAPKLYFVLVRHRLWLAVALTGFMIATRGVWLHPIVLPIFGLSLR